MCSYSLQYFLVLVIMTIIKTIFLSGYYFLESVKFSITGNKGQAGRPADVILLAYVNSTNVNT